jgi:sugar lactone lactonase YvrE
VVSEIVEGRRLRRPSDQDGEDAGEDPPAQIRLLPVPSSRDPAEDGHLDRHGRKVVAWVFLCFMRPWENNDVFHPSRRRARRALLVLLGGIAPLLVATPAGAGPEAAAVVVDHLEDGQTFHQPESVHVAPSGHVYVADTGINRIVRFDAAGEFVAAYGSTGSGNGQLNHPYQVTVDADGNMYVADGFNYRVQKLDPDGAFVAAVPLDGTDIPTGIAVLDGQVYVANHTDNRIQVYDDSLTGGVLRTISSFGTTNGLLQGPRNLDIANGRLYVADQFNDRISIFTAATGAFVRKIGSEGDTAGRFESPLGVAAEADGTVFAADTFNQRIQRFTPAGRYVEEVGGTYSAGLDVAADGRIYVANTLGNSVDVYQRGDGVLVDARIQVGNGALRGNDVYDRTAGNHQIGVRTVAPGTTVRYTLTFQNDSTAPDRIRVRAPRPATRYSVVYRRGTQNVTAAMHAGTLQSPVLAPQAVFTITAQVTMARAAQPGQNNIRVITATSVNRPTVRDAVKMSTVRRF